MESVILEVVERIAKLKDKAEEDKWLLAESVHDAYAEFKPYEQGLTASLMDRLGCESTTLYNWRNAWNLKVIRRLTTSLTVSHCATLHDLGLKFDLSDDDLKEYISLAEDERWSVRKMRQEISQNHFEEIEKQEKRLLKSLIKKMRSFRQTQLLYSVLDDVWRAVYYDLLKELESWE